MEQCTLCGRQLSSKADLDNHLAIQHELGPLQCPHCRRNLSSKQNLKNHIFTHTGEKPYVCLEPGCSQSFRQNSQYSTHKKTHEHAKLLGRTGEVSSDAYPIFLSDMLVRNPGSLAEPKCGEPKTPTAEIFLPVISEDKQGFYVESGNFWIEK